MKFLIRLLLLTFIAIEIISFNLKSSNKAKEDYTQQWLSLFTTLNIPPQMCMHPDPLRRKINPDENALQNNGTEVLMPQAKPNRWAKQQGTGIVAYLFDHWDYLFQAEVTTYFTNMYNAAKAIIPPPTNVYDEPYSLDKMLYYFSQGAKGSLTGVSGAPADLIKQISNYNKNFDPSVWQNSISVAQVYQILSTWGWKGVFSANPAKRLVDMYDFDGDGRLNPTEFILFAIKNNKQIFRLPECKQYCFEELFKSKIDPLFRFMDCDQDGFISAENMWNVLTLLKRPDPNTYNMYKCIMPTLLNTGYRTICDSDFILKNSRKYEGFVDITEFRAGVLLGYWDRQTDSHRIYSDDTKTLKGLRWSPDGKTDIQCENILSLAPGGKPVMPPPAQNTQPSYNLNSSSTSNTGPSQQSAQVNSPVTPSQQSDHVNTQLASPQQSGIIQPVSNYLSTQVSRIGQLVNNQNQKRK
jgi:Ca2+-binding EF-hand superfamily protein